MASDGIHRVFLAAPFYGNIDPSCLTGWLHATQRRDYGVVVETHPKQSSALCNNFNSAFCECMNTREQKNWTAMAMIHADIGTQPGWLDIMLEEMEREEAFVCSAVCCIKDARGATTTGVSGPHRQGVRRLTMTEIMKLPETFDLDDVRIFDQEPRWNYLAINTGLWVMRLGEWMEDFPGFCTLDRITRSDDGTYTASVLTEDWNFSAWLAAKKRRVVATRKVKTEHFGSYGYPNDRVWGEWKTDVINMPRQVSVEEEKPRVQVAVRPVLVARSELASEQPLRREHHGDHSRSGTLCRSGVEFRQPVECLGCRNHPGRRRSIRRVDERHHHWWRGQRCEPGKHDDRWPQGRHDNSADPGRFRRHSTDGFLQRHDHLDAAQRTRRQCGQHCNHGHVAHPGNRFDELRCRGVGSLPWPELIRENPFCLSFREPA